MKCKLIAIGKQCWEKYYPYLITLFLLAIILWYANSDRVNLTILESTKKNLFSNGFLGSILTIESILLGFLLMVLTLTLQSNNKNMQELRKSKRFNELISYNRNAVIFSFWTIITTTIVMLTYGGLDHIVYSIFLYVWGGCTLISVIATFRFLDIFYALIKE